MAKPELLDRCHDVVIAGGGIAGLTLALALKKALGDAISVCLCDARVTADGTDQRASAIAPDGVSFFRRIGVWDAIADKTQPILAMKVIDAFKSDTFRPAMLTFVSKSVDSGPLAHMTFHADLERELFATCAANGVVSYPQNFRNYAVSGDWAQASLDTGEMLRCALIVAADGARSKLRSQARITTIGRAYGQSAIVVTIEHAKDHEAVAFENFLPSGVLATLPLPGRRSSIVWVEQSEVAQRLVLASPDVFMASLREAVGPRLGALSVVGAPRAFALNLQIARRFVGDRLRAPSTMGAGG